MKLNLGAGNDVLSEYTNHDLTKHRDDIDITWDLNEKNWSDFTKLHNFDEIRASDVIEHINDPINFMDNCWELMAKGGLLIIKACGWQNPNLHVDITHKRGYDIKSFDYFDPTTEIGSEYGFYTKKRWTIIEKHYDKRLNVIITLTPIK